MGTFLHSWWEYKLIQLLWRIERIFLKKIRLELPYDTVILLLGIYPEKAIIEKDTCTPRFIAALFTIARTWRQLRCPPIDKWIKKMWYIYTREYWMCAKLLQFCLTLPSLWIVACYAPLSVGFSR